MVKIDFKNFRLFSDIAHKKSKIVDIKEELADAIYSQGTGVVHHALALKIYNSTQETELNDKEVKLLLEFVNCVCSPNMIDSLVEIINEEKKKTKD